MQEEAQQEKGPLPRIREAVDWWLKKWNRQAVVDGKEPLTREDVERLIEVNGGTAEGLSLVGRNLLDLNLEGCDISGADLRGAILSAANLQGASLRGVDLRGADLYMAKMQGAALSGARLDGANLEWALLQQSYLMLANLEHAALWETNLEGAFLWYADLEGADLRGSNLQGADLRNANLQGARLLSVRISSDSNLEGVKWDKDYISVLERQGDYEAAIALYRRLKEWYRGAGMLKIAGEFHYREEEAITKARGQQLWSDIKQIGDEFREFKRGVKAAWQQLKRKDADPQLKE